MTSPSGVLADRIEVHLNLDTTATLILSEDNFRTIVDCLRAPGGSAPSVDLIANIISDYYDEDAAGRWRKCAEHVVSALTPAERQK